MKSEDGSCLNLSEGHEIEIEVVLFAVNSDFDSRLSTPFSLAQQRKAVKGHLVVFVIIL